MDYAIIAILAVVLATIVSSVVSLVWASFAKRRRRDIFMALVSYILVIALAVGLLVVFSLRGWSNLGVLWVVVIVVLSSALVVWVRIVQTFAWPRTAILAGLGGALVGLFFWQTANQFGPSFEVGGPSPGSSIAMPKIEPRIYRRHVEACAQLLTTQHVTAHEGADSFPHLSVQPLTDFAFLIELEGQSPNLALRDPRYRERITIGVRIFRDWFADEAQGEFWDAGSKRARGGAGVQLPDARFAPYTAEERPALDSYIMRVGTIVGDCIAQKAGETAGALATPIILSSGGAAGASLEIVPAPQVSPEKAPTSAVDRAAVQELTRLAADLLLTVLDEAQVGDSPTAKIAEIRAGLEQAAIALAATPDADLGPLVDRSLRRLERAELCWDPDNPACPL